MTHYKIFSPNNPSKNHSPKATLLIVHGMAEYQDRYAKFAQYLADQEIAVLTFDQLGHGESARQSQTLGYIGGADPAEHMITYTLQHAEILAKLYPNVPHFILGFSMGSFITRVILQTHSHEFAGAILVGTADANPMIANWLHMTHSLNFFLPKIYNPYLHYSIGLLFNAYFYQEKNIGWLNWLNSDPDQVREFVADPLCGFCFTNNGYYALVSLMAEATNGNWANNIRRDLPMLWLSGKDDPIGQMGCSVPNITNSLKMQGFHQIAMNQFEHMRHDILHEPNHLIVYQEIVTWINTVLRSS